MVFTVGCLFALALPAYGQLNEDCTVSVFNRTAQVQPDGVWVLPNVPTTLGQVRARATCVENGVTRSGQSDFFVIPLNGSVDVPEIQLDAVDPIPSSLLFSPQNPILNRQGSILQVTVTAAFPDGSTSDVSAQSAGTNYTSSNSTIATVSPNGLVTAISSGTVLITALNEGALGLLQVQVALSGDSDGDGIPDDQEVALGLNPNDPVDAIEDSDQDGLTNAQEIAIGTEIFVADTDGDGILDGIEVAGSNGFVTNPLLADTDGDGIRDGLEVATGSDPTDPASFNLADTLSTIVIAPSISLITFNFQLLSEASRQLTVTGTLVDGTVLDLTPGAKGTNYTSNSLGICGFGGQSGQVFASAEGTCIVTASNSGFSANATIVVQTFSPTSVSSIDIPGYANNVDVSGDLVFVAAGSAGVHAIDISDRSAPVILGTFDTPGNANDVQVMGTLGYVADGTGGLQILDISDPSALDSPGIILGAVQTPSGGEAWDISLSGPRVYVASGNAGLQIVDVTDPATPTELSVIDTVGIAKGVAVDPIRMLAMVADGSSGMTIVNVADAMNPIIESEGIQTGVVSDARDIVVKGETALIADFENSLTAIDITTPSSPGTPVSIPLATGGRLMDIAASGSFAFGADVFFVNGVPIFNVSDSGSPFPITTLDFTNIVSDANGTGIAGDSQYVYLTTSPGIIENGVDVDPQGQSTKLQIGKYLMPDVPDGSDPTVMITAPTNGSSVIEGTILPIVVEATDDMGIVGVEFFVDGQLVSTDTTFPYQLDHQIGQGLGTLTLGAKALDLGNNEVFAPEIQVDIVPDPFTTVVGTVVDQDGTPIVNAEVTTIGDVSSFTAADGSFEILNVPTIQGSIQVSAIGTTPEGMVGGNSISVSPVPNGITDVGEIRATGSLMLLQSVGFNVFNPGMYLVNVNSFSIVSFFPDTTRLVDAVTLDGATALRIFSPGVLNSGQIDFFNLLTNPITPSGTFFTGTSFPLFNGGAVGVGVNGNFVLVGDIVRRRIGDFGFNDTGDPAMSVNVDTRQLINQVDFPPGTGVQKFAISPDGSMALGSAPFVLEAVRVFSLSASGELSDTGQVVPSGGAPGEILIAPNGELALVENGPTFQSPSIAPSLGILDIANGTVTFRETIDVGEARIDSMAITSDGTKAYITVGDDPFIQVFNINNNSLILPPTLLQLHPDTAAVGVGSFALTCDGERLVVLLEVDDQMIDPNLVDRVVVLDAATDTVIGSLPFRFDTFRITTVNSSCQ